MSWRRFFRRKRADTELAHEIDHYLTEEMNENLAQGLSAGEARRRAYVKFGILIKCAKASGSKTPSA